MKDQLRALIFDQRHRAAHIRELEADLRGDAELAEQRKAITADLRAGERDLVESLSVVESDLIGARYFLQSAETSFWKAERRLAALVRYSDEDKLLTLVTHRLCDEIRWPGRKPVVCCTADSGYQTWGEADLIFVAPVDNRRVLAWPDICHEMGHALVASKLVDFDEFESRTLHEYFKSLSQRPVEEAEPGDPDSIIDWNEAAQWGSSAWLDWTEEFACDVFGCYAAGPGYARQHLRLSVVSQRSIYDPIPPDTASHPPDLARASVIAATLRVIGHEAEATELTKAFGELAGLEEKLPPEQRLVFDVTFAEELITGLVDRVVGVCRALSIREFSDGDSDSIVHLLTEAWERLHSNPDEFPEHEHTLVERLRAEVVGQTS